MDSDGTTVRYHADGRTDEGANDDPCYATAIFPLTNDAPNSGKLKAKHRTVRAIRAAAPLRAARARLAPGFGASLWSLRAYDLAAQL